MEFENIFISYSWDNAEHKQWSKYLADRLEEISELTVSFDQYDLDSLSDKNHFMEKSVFETDLILAVITDNYKTKANDRVGGVGIETSMVTSRHWEESLSLGKSNIIPILREGDSVPNYLKNKFYIDFRNNDEFDKSFERLLEHIKGTSKSSRPQKKYSIKKIPIVQEFTRIEDFLKINYKNRKLVFDKSKSTDFSGNNRIKFELWETKSPSLQYYLFLFYNTSIEKTVQRISALIKQANLKISNLTVLKRNNSKKGYLSKLFKDNGLNINLTELTYSEYIWEYCIDEDAKRALGIYTRPNFIDQSLISNDQAKDDLGPAFDYLKKKLKEEEQSTANVIIAPGGTGKTTLCSNLAKFYQKESDVIPVFIESEEMKKSSTLLARKQIKSVFDLYDAYSSVCINQDDEYVFNKVTFEVSILTGKLVLIIDGLDEIIPIFHEGFDVEQFLKSIDDLNKEMSSSKIIITSRNDVISESLVSKYSNISKFLLLGFDDKTCQQYLEKRFKKYSNSIQMIKSAQNNIKPLISKDENQRVLPFIVDLLSSIVEDSQGNDSVKLELSFKDKDYESNSELTDYLVYSILRRESVRQSIEISISEVLDIFLELAVSHSDEFPVQDLENIIEVYYPEIGTELTDKLIRNPLISLDNNICSFKYDFISEYFNTLSIIHFINSGSRDDGLVKLTAKHAYGDSNVFKDVLKYFQSKDHDSENLISNIIRQIKSSLKYDDVFKKDDYRFRAMSFLTNIILELNKNSSKSEKMDCLKRVYGDDNNIYFLSIYGDAKPLDFSNTHVFNSKFVGYKNFTLSKFDNATFSNCVFNNVNSDHIATNLSSNMFDSCQMGDLDIAIELAKNRNQENRALVEKELRTFFTSFFNRARFVDQKKSYVKFSDKVKGIDHNFFDNLLSQKIIEVKLEKSDETYFQVNASYHDSVYTLIMNNTVDDKIQRIIDVLI
ncbi:TIR domain-containing protein [Vibrio furnissii]|uniref:TIR domain-containing protein n=1 Tax=Vibrio furnissii TaxID=29494 RepID=UPI00257222D6|nr:TIR domain-containing protein [Vibrio furnissii]WJG25224.1 TIR domain-containing protein [Vibrio furnissii]